MSSFGSRVPIPNTLRRTIQDIKEIAGKHSDEDIYAMLKECNMDPNETAQKLLYLDTFHEVRKRRDKKKMSANVRASEEHRWPSSMQRQGSRGGRGNNNTSFGSNDVLGQRQVTAQQENGVKNFSGRSSGPSAPVRSMTDSGSMSSITNSNNSPGSGLSSVPNGSSSHQSGSEVREDNKCDLQNVSPAVDPSRLRKLPGVPNVDVEQHSNFRKSVNAAPLFKTTSRFASGDRNDVADEKSGPSILTSLTSGSMDGVYSSASDPVLVPPLSPRNPSAVGTIKCETGNQRIASDLVATTPAGSSGGDGQNDFSSSKTNSGVNTNISLHPGDNPGQFVEHSKLSSTVISKSTSAMISQDSNPAQQLEESLRGVATEHVLQPNSEIDVKIEKLNLSDRHPVVFPHHLQVPEALKTGLTFGSLDATTEQSSNFGHNDGTIATVKDATIGASMSQQSALPVAQDGKGPDHPQLPSNPPENVPPLEGGILSIAAPTYDHSKGEMVPHLGASPYPFLQAAPDYSLSLVPPLIGPPLVHFEGSELQGASPPTSVPSASGSNQPMVQPVGVGHNSIAVAPQMLPFLRQPYPPSYISYNPYFPHLYLPTQGHQFIGHTGFPQQPPSSNIYMQPAAATGVKFPVPPPYKPGTVAASLSHLGIPSGYGSPYGNTSAGVNPDPSANLTPVSSASDEPTVLKEKNIYSMVKQNDDLHSWNSVPGRDLASLQASFYYGLPQGHHLSILPMQSGHGTLAGMYNPSQIVVAQTVQSLPQHSQGIAGSVESATPSANNFQQPHAQISWNTKLLNRENIGG